MDGGQVEQAGASLQRRFRDGQDDGSGSGGCQQRFALIEFARLKRDSSRTAGGDVAARSIGVQEADAEQGGASFHGLDMGDIDAAPSEFLDQTEAGLVGAHPGDREHPESGAPKPEPINLAT